MILWCYALIFVLSGLTYRNHIIAVLWNIHVHGYAIQNSWFSTKEFKHFEFIRTPSYQRYDSCRIYFGMHKCSAYFEWNLKVVVIIETDINKGRLWWVTFFVDRYNSWYQELWKLSHEILLLVILYCNVTLNES